MKELSTSYKAVLTTLRSATTVKAASNAVLLQFERSANQSAAVQDKRAGYGQTYYEKYAAKTAEKEESTVATKITTPLPSSQSDAWTWPRTIRLCMLWAVLAPP